jgi:hypothetical protein
MTSTHLAQNFTSVATCDWSNWCFVSPYSRCQCRNGWCDGFKGYSVGVNPDWFCSEDSKWPRRDTCDMLLVNVLTQWKHWHGSGNFDFYSEESWRYADCHEEFRGFNLWLIFGDRDSKLPATALPHFPQFVLHKIISYFFPRGDEGHVPALRNTVDNTLWKSGV